MTRFYLLLLACCSIAACANDAEVDSTTGPPDASDMVEPTVDSGRLEDATTISSDAEVEMGVATGEARVDPALWDRALTDWETKMAERGTTLGEKFLSQSSDEINQPPYPWYYDSARAFYQVGDYLGDPDGTWASYATAAAAAYRDYIEPNYGMPGYERFSEGLALDYLRSDDADSRMSVERLQVDGPFADILVNQWADGWAQQGSSREIAYMIESHVWAERIGLDRRPEALEAYVSHALSHIEIWTTGNYLTDDPNWQFCQSFMTGLTASALIEYYELTVDTGAPDERIPPALQTLGDWLAANMWVEDYEIEGTYPYEPAQYGAFKYVSPPVDGVGGEDPAPDLNLLIAPLFGWLYMQTGNLEYRNVGDLAFIGGVAFAYLVPDKAFNQNYRTSFDYVRWRAEGLERWRE